MNPSRSCFEKIFQDVREQNIDTLIRSRARIEHLGEKRANKANWVKCLAMGHGSGTSVLLEQSTFQTPAAFHPADALQDASHPEPHAVVIHLQS